MKAFNIYFTDLKEGVQKELCEYFNTTPEKENWDSKVFPIAIMEREEKD